jgi:hypothetical protein
MKNISLCSVNWMRNRLFIRFLSMQSTAALIPFYWIAKNGMNSFFHRRRQSTLDELRTAARKPASSEAAGHQT